ncbi:EAL domain-containing protein [Halomonas campisalis]|uniref:EAL domain-containing protein n=1 Tax=Billgrantia campisalis TaxID=74661 RepID=A0ABS9P719_9GAMM|nr:EAL domain-containing protein [Halomonas campisalis]MCG6656910.1 EAL domain-containing protein [Halomonas campisalis]MDR5862099.1 EAL domain-containing protein [Halomonas campisalis]
MHQFFNRLSLEARFIIALSLPLITLIWLATSGALERQKLAVNMSELQALTSLAVDAGDLVHRLQVERGMSSGFLGSGGSHFGEQLHEARRQTDRQVSRFHDRLQGFDISRLAEQQASGRTIANFSLHQGPLEDDQSYLSFLQDIRGTTRSFERLQGIRDDVNAHRLEADDAIRYYSQVNYRLNALIGQLTHLTDQGEINRKLGAYHALLMYKELAGLERALLSNALARGLLPQTIYQRIMPMMGEQSAFLATFHNLADRQASAALSALLTADETRQLEAFRQRIIDRGPLAKLDVTPDQWFDWKTLKIEHIKTVEDTLSNDIMATAAGLKAAAQGELTQYLALSIVSTLIAVLLSFLIIRNIQNRLQLAANVFHHTQDGITVTGPDATILDLNDAFTRITGYPREEAIGRNPRFLQSGRQDSAFYRALWNELLTTGSWQGEIWNRRKNGEVYAELLTINAVHDKRGRLQNYVAVFSDITERASEHQRQLVHSANHDPLTDLPNRMLLGDRLRHALSISRRSNTPLVVAIIDLDDFKSLNETYGHALGDRVLELLAKRFQSALREGDTLARLGGDEFAAVIEELAAADDAKPILQRLQQEAAQPIRLEGVTLHCSASIGATHYPDDASDADTLLRHANQAMHEAKLNGRNRLHWFDPRHNHDQSALSRLVERIEAALTNGELVLHYQPKVNMRTGRLIGAEALLRWQDPEGGLVPPGDFLPQIERHPISVKIGNWVIETALNEVQRWQSLGLALPVSVNINALQLQQPDFVARLGEQLAAHADVAPGALELEILESAAIGDIALAGEVIRQCRALGVAVSLDDFGTGYAALEYLKYLPADRLKIDRTFIRDMLDDTGDLAIVKGIIGLAEAFEFQVIAEGVETEAQGRRLIALGCEQAQGFGIARPMPSRDLVEWSACWQPPAGWNQAGEKTEPER